MVNNPFEDAGRWSITREDREKFDQIFYAKLIDIYGRLASRKAFSDFAASAGFSDIIIADALRLVLPGRQEVLNSEQFAVAMVLLRDARTRKKDYISMRLPDELRESAIESSKHSSLYQAETSFAPPGIGGNISPYTGTIVSPRDGMEQSITAASLPPPVGPSSEAPRLYEGSAAPQYNKGGNPFSDYYLDRVTGKWVHKSRDDILVSRYAGTRNEIHGPSDNSFSNYYFDRVTGKWVHKSRDDTLVSRYAGTRNEIHGPSDNPFPNSSFDRVTGKWVGQGLDDTVDSRRATPGNEISSVRQPVSQPDFSHDHGLEQRTPRRSDGKLSNPRAQAENGFKFNLQPDSYNITESASGGWSAEYKGVSSKLVPEVQNSEVDIPPRPILPRNDLGSDLPMTRESIIERQMKTFFPSPKTQPPFQSFTETTCMEIGELLTAAGQPQWSRIPRTYIVCRLAGQLHFMDAFVNAGCTDFWFPYSLDSLPDQMSNPDARARFLELQTVVLSSAYTVEDTTSMQHAYFASCEDIPYHTLEELGQGGFGSVDKVESSLSLKVYARKRISRRRTFKGMKEVLKDFERELSALQKVSHEHRHIVQLIGSYTCPKYVGLIMSPDIKPRNILLHRTKIYLTDFGLARDATAHTRSTTAGLPAALSERYAAPEVANWDPRSYEADIWSLGCVFLEMTTVLLGHTLQELDGWMATEGSRLALFRLNMDGVEGWIGDLRKGDRGGDVVPLEWVEKMLVEQRESRISARKLYEDITEPEVTRKVLFCGMCCTEDGEDSPEE
ncbi:MAG: hypothetical protein M1814_003777 [Vezdaea aestivalis]|nr:MAG: hypothetical protein M1814_003777 [Vezdaea aestivalis]